MKHIVVLSGAGMSAESGLKTFRDSGGLWEGYDVMQVASIEGWINNPELVLDFYNMRRKQLLKALPNAAHSLLAQLEKKFDVTIVTQNVDDLHERAGSSHVIHLHGELFKVKSTRGTFQNITWKKDLVMGDLCPDGYQLRPDIVWFGEAVPRLEAGAMAVAQADMVIIIGTSMQVYPAAGLVAYAKSTAPIFYIDPHPTISHELRLRKNLYIIEESATVGVERLIQDHLS